MNIDKFWIAGILIGSLCAGCQEKASDLSGLCKPGAKQCTEDKTGFQVCTEDETWGEVQKCTQEQECEDGVCQQATDTNACKPGTKQCTEDKTGYQVCAEHGTWGEVQKCTQEQVCEDGACQQATDINACKPGTKRCTEDKTGYQVCAEDGTWGEIQNCAFQEICEINTCIEICPAGAVRCSVNHLGIQRCSDIGRWLEVEDCEDNTVCDDSDKKCKCIEGNLKLVCEKCENDKDKYKNCTMKECKKNAQNEYKWNSKTYDLSCQPEELCDMTKKWCDVEASELETYTCNNSDNVGKYPTDKSLIAKNAGLYDKLGNKIVLRGVVMPNVDTDQFNASVSKQVLKKLKTIGVNMIRFTVKPQKDVLIKLDKESIYQRIERAIDNASSLGMYSIVDWGVMKATIGNPLNTLCLMDKSELDNCKSPLTSSVWTTAQEFFARISCYSKNNPYVLFEIANEPCVDFNGTGCPYHSTWTAVENYADQIIPIIRSNSENIIIVAGTSGVILPKSEKCPDCEPLNKYSNIAYTFHNYPFHYKFDKYSESIDTAIKNNLTIITTEMAPIDPSLSEQNKSCCDLESMKKYVDNYYQITRNTIDDNKTSLSFAWFKFDFPFEGEPYREWSILKPINSVYYDTHCNEEEYKSLDICTHSDADYSSDDPTTERTKIRHMSNLNLDSNNKKERELVSNYKYTSTSDDELPTSEDELPKGKGVYSTSGCYFYHLLNRDSIDVDPAQNCGTADTCNK